MTYFTEELKKYYHHFGNEIVFNNGQSLNQLALSLWEELNYSGIDASVLSRVLQGKRFFTLKQLEAFCTILNLTFKEKIDIYDSWKQTLLANKDIKDLSSFFLSPSNEHIYHLIESCFELLYQGKCFLLYEYTDSIIKSVYQDDDILGELKIFLLYLKGRFYGSTEKGRMVILKTASIIKQLKKIAVDDTELKYGLIYTLYANACYVYAKYTGNQNYISKGMKLCEKALALNYIMSEKIFAARTFLSLVILTHDKSLIEKIRKRVEELLVQINQPKDFTSGYHLASSIALSLTHENSDQGFNLLQAYQQKYKINLFNRGNYSLSFIQNEIDMCLLVDEKKERIQKLLDQGLILSKQEDINRYAQYFKKISFGIH